MVTKTINEIDVHFRNRSCEEFEIFVTKRRFITAKFYKTMKLMRWMEWSLVSLAKNISKVVWCKTRNEKIVQVKSFRRWCDT